MKHRGALRGVHAFHSHALLSAIASLVIAGSCVIRMSAGIESRDGTAVLPVIDQRDVRLIVLSANGEGLNKWIKGIAQDNRGYMWFATDGGLFQYDGYTLTPYLHDPDNPNSIASDDLNTVFSDRAGIIWIGTHFDGLDRLDPKRGAFTHYRHRPGVDTSLGDDDVLSIYQDRNGALWVGNRVELSRFDPASGTFLHYKPNPRDSTSLTAGDINCIYEDREGNFWVGTIGGLNKFDRATGRSSRFVYDPKDPHSIGHDYVGAIAEDQAGTLWVGSLYGDGLSALDVKTQKFKRYSFSSEKRGSESIQGVTRLLADADGSLWVGTIDNGLLKLDAARREFRRYTNGNAARIFEDAEGLIWVGTRARGVMRFPGKQSAFVNYREDINLPHGLRPNDIQSVGTDSRGHLWIGKTGGVEMLDTKTGRVTVYRHDANNHQSISDGEVLAIAQDRSGRMWFGSYGTGLNSFDEATGQFLTLRHDPHHPGGLSGNLIICLLVDHEGTLWVGTQMSGLDRYDPTTGLFKNYTVQSRVTTLYEDHKGTLWLGGEELRHFDPGSGQSIAYHHDPADPGSLSDETVNVIYEDRRGTLWVGTNNGLNRLNPSGTFTRVTTKDGLRDDYIKGILEDRHGDLWLATQDGLSHFSPRTGRIHNYFQSDGLPGNNFYLLGKEAGQTPEGEMVFGSSNALSVFDPDRLSPNSYVPPVVLTDFLLFNKHVRPDGKSPLRKPIWGTNALTLDHNQNIFTLEFAALSYTDPERNKYRYRLDGLEKDWNEVDSKQRLATYTNLAAGKYVFRVQGSNNDLLWNEAGVSLAISVLPPWWETWWFRTGLVFCIAGLIVTTYRMRMKALQSTAARLEVEVAERTIELKAAKDAAESANRAKSAFLSLMSHELRTPLNAILGFASLLRRDIALQKQRGDLEIISRSGEHLLGLINELLDLAKIEAGRGTTEIAPFDLRRLIRDVSDMMQVRALEKNLDLKMTQSAAFPRFVETDAPKLRQMLINLLGNAITHTERGSVTLRLDALRRGDAEQMLLSFEVEDSGIGITPEDQERIFEPFVQVGRSRRPTGTGLGLTITRQYAVILGGSLRVSSTPGEGSLFRLELPAKCTEPVAADPVESEREFILTPGQPEFRILVVDDEPESRTLLQRLLQKAGFEVQVAEDGAQAVETFENWWPHFIWMDLRMHGVDGAEAARRIRAMPGGQQVRIAAVTASENTHSATGMDDIVRKPYRTHEIFECMKRHLGLTWRAGEPDEGEPSPQVPAGLRPEALAALPADLRVELTNAVVTLDAGQIAAVIERISRVDAELGSALTRYADRFSLTAVWEALNESKSIVSET